MQTSGVRVIMRTHELAKKASLYWWQFIDGWMHDLSHLAHCALDRGDRAPVP